MEAMGVFAEAFGYTPDEYRAITLRDRSRLVAFLNSKNERPS